MTKQERATLKKYKEWAQKHEEKCKALAAKRQEEKEQDEERIADGICLIGEISPCVDAATTADARKTANDWLQLLGLPIVDEEALIDAERRVYDEWHRRGCPGYDVNTRSLVESYFTLPRVPRKFEDVWTPLQS